MHIRIIADPISTGTNNNTKETVYKIENDQ